MSTRLSIVTPSFNQAEFVQKCLDSVAGQKTLPFEHLIYDGGSKDGTVELLQAYAKDKPWVTLNVGKDRGQVDAINKGFTAAQGDIITWLNTDDFFIDDKVIADVLDAFERHPEADFIYGGGEFVDQHGTYLKDVYINTDAEKLSGLFMHSVGILQPATFFRRSVFEDIGPLRESIGYCFDYEYWMRAVAAGKLFVNVDRKFTRATLHSDSKTIGDRQISLRQTTELVKEYYGFASVQWTNKLARCIASGADGIVDSTDKLGDELAGLQMETFLEFNGSKGGQSAILSRAHQKDTYATLKYFKENVELDTSRSFVTAFNTKFFASGLTMIAGLHRHYDKAPPVFVYDIGLTETQRELLLNLENVFVLDFQKTDFNFFEDYLSPVTYGFKSYATWHVQTYLRKNDKIVWIDAGIYPLNNLDRTFHEIEQEDILLVDHDDKSIWPVWNSTFTSDECAKAMKLTPKELLAPHLRAGFLGYKIGGKFAKMFEEAFQLSLRPEILTGDKHPKPPIYRTRDGGTGEERERAVSDPEYQKTLSQEKIRELFGYFGHRHDQSIVSNLAARYNAPYRSAQQFCVADNVSSASSTARWKSEGDASNYEITSTIPRFYSESGADVAQHRGLFLNTDGLRFIQVDTDRPVIVLGNGPSLKGFDFARFKGMDVFGMNAAYRYWEEINWYPSYYICLDLVVGLSHKDQIRDLIENSDKNGIRLFFLRKNLIDEMGDLKFAHKVVNFDEISRYSSVLQAPTLTTGSHACSFAALLGYKNIYLLGVDCSYVEKVTGSKETGVGTELEIVDSAENPNYFFAGYQQVGDKYNIPNPNRNIHLEAWQEVGQLIDPTRHRVLNANLMSKVDAFDFCKFEDVERGGAVKVIPKSEILGEPAADEQAADDKAPKAAAPALVSTAPQGEAPEPAAVHSRPVFNSESMVSNRAKLTALVRDMLRRRGLPLLAYGGAVAGVFAALFFSPFAGVWWLWLALFGLFAAGIFGAIYIAVSHIRLRMSYHFNRLHQDMLSRISQRAMHGQIGRVDKAIRQTHDSLKLVRGDITALKAELGARANMDGGLKADALAEIARLKTQMTALADAQAHAHASEQQAQLAAVQASIDAMWDRTKKALFARAEETERVNRDLETLLERVDGLGNGLSRELGSVQHELGTVREELGFVREEMGSVQQSTKLSHAEFVDQLARKADAIDLDAANRRIQTETDRMGQIASDTIAQLANLKNSLNDRAGSDRVDVLSRMLASAFVEIDSIDQTVEALREGSSEVAALREYVARQMGLVTSQVGDATEQIGDVRTQVSGVTEELGEVRLQVSGFTEEVGDVRRQVADVTEQVGDVRDQIGEVTGKVDGVTKQIAPLAERIDGLATDLDQRPSAVDLLDTNDRIDKFLAEQDDTRLNELAASVVDFSTALTALKDDLDERAPSGRVQQIAKRLSECFREVEKCASAETVEGLRAQVEELEAQIAEQPKAGVNSQAQAQMAQRISAISDELHELERSFSLVRDGVRSDWTSLRSEVEEVSALATKSLQATNTPFLNGEAKSIMRSGISNVTNSVRFNRSLRKEHATALIEDWSERLDLKLDSHQLFYMAKRVCDLEHLARGRLATDVEDAVLRCLVATAVKAKTLSVLEIGTLFGIGAGSMYDLASPQFTRTHLTLLDPLEGYYGEGHADILTGLPISERILRANMDRMGIGKTAYTLIKHYSHEDKALEMAAKRKYDVLVIDGDHTYDGVKVDFEKYASMVRVGGYILFDDYGSTDWPDVKAYVDDEVNGLDGIERVGDQWRTAVFRVQKQYARDA